SKDFYLDPSLSGSVQIQIEVTPEKAKLNGGYNCAVQLFDQTGLKHPVLFENSIPKVSATRAVIVIDTNRDASRMKYEQISIQCEGFGNDADFITTSVLVDNKPVAGAEIRSRFGEISSFGVTESLNVH